MINNDLANRIHKAVLILVPRAIEGEKYWPSFFKDSEDLFKSFENVFLNHGIEIVLSHRVCFKYKRVSYKVLIKGFGKRFIDEVVSYFSGRKIPLNVDFHFILLEGIRRTFYVICTDGGNTCLNNLQK